MTVFKTYFKVLNKCKGVVILYSVILITFAISQLQTGDQTTNFVESRPDIYIINEGADTELTDNFKHYMEKHCTLKEISHQEEALSDALFYREVNYIVYLPKNYSADFMRGKNPEIKVRSTGDYQASLAEMLVNKYIETANICQTTCDSEKALTKAVNQILEDDTEVVVTSKLDTDALAKVAVYYNFANYSLLAGCVYVICLIVAGFREEKIRKRIMISSMDYKKHNLLLLCANAIFAITLWGVYVLLSILLLREAVFTLHGLIYILNAFIFTICCLTIALLIGSVVNRKEALGGIVNVLALGSSFLCGAFVPMDWLPDGVLKVAHILPSYWYIKTNELLKTMEVFDTDNIKAIGINMGMLLGFIILFIIINNIVTRKKSA